MLVYVFNFDLFEFSAPFLEKGLLRWYDTLKYGDVNEKFKVF